MNIPNYILNIIGLLEEAGFSAYLVGGCVRDFFLGKACQDFDMTTNASPEQIKNVFKDYKTLDTGIKHGTVGVVCGEGLVEITTFRSDGSYLDNRHPDKVSFSKSIEDDLLRRDFTINAIAYNCKTGFIDLYDGKNDIKNKIIRCVGEPRKRFEEDSLRILRALRFASTLGFEIEKETSLAIKEKKHLLSNLSAERILKELYGILNGDYVKDILIEYKEIFFEIIPELKPLDKLEQNSPYHIYDVYEHTAVAVENAPKDNSLRLAMLLHDIGKQNCYTEDENGKGHFYSHGKISAELSKNILDRLRLPNKDKALILKLIYHHSDALTTDKKNIKAFLRIFGNEDFKKFLYVRYADCMAKSPETTKSNLEYLIKISRVYEEIISNNECYNINMLQINGKDIESLGYYGKEIGNCLELTLEAIIDGKIKNNKDSILNYIKLNKYML